MLNVHGEWPLVGRDPELAEARNALLDSAWRGVIITGQSGVGKTALAQRIAREVDDSFELVYVRGSAIASKMPYGALSFVLSDLDDAIVGNPLMLLRGLQELYARREDGRQTLILADNLEELDSSSAMALAHLVRVGAVKLIAICQSIDASPEEFCDLWKDGVLRRIDLEPLNLAATTRLLSAALDAPVSRAAAASMWHTTGGNPLFLQALTREQVDSGEMLERDGVWVAKPLSVPKTRRSMTDWIMVRLRRMPAEEREALELISVVGVAPLDLLLRFVPSSALDSLQERKAIDVEHGDSPNVRVANGLVSEVVRSQVPLGRGRELMRAIATETRGASMPAITRMSYAAWCLEIGAELDAETLIDAARLANRLREGESALRFIHAIPNYSAIPQAVIEEAHALGVDGDTSGGLMVLDQFLKTHAAPQLHDWVEVGLLQCRLLMRNPSRHAEAEPLLAEIRRRLSVETGAPDIEALVNQTDMLAAELAVHNGRYAELLEEYSDFLLDRSSELQNHGLLGWVAEALAMTGRQDDGVRLASSMLSRLVDSGGDTLLQEAAMARIFKLMVLSGRWNECIEMAASPANHGKESAYDGSASEFAEGCLLAYAGRGTEALDKLLPALSQIRVRDRQQTLPIAEATTAYAYALVGEARAAQEHLGRTDHRHNRMSWHNTRATEYFATLAMLATKAPVEVAERMLELADEDHALGNIGHELLFLCQAVQLGLESAADRLFSSALASQGPFAEVCALYGKGIASKDTHQLLLASQKALELGNHRLAADAARLAAHLAQESGEEVAVTEADRVLRGVGAPGVTGRRGALESLTDRERSIAVLAAQGHTNRDIAQVMCVSVRTIEGHIYRLYSKLGVSSRSQLALLLE
ncbi:AAA ATPase domain-containing protein [Arthrobacter subterraneus]|uniref:AAA ATPase domain-containing protein n=1 Tax=Arthrobacter subterraneus TaxID=335973 RepID=A0A1G8J3L1_9MICC|nr:LuxR C-terminal-related transcriptional regulator [Arthrobacter subterraneus]SDI25845.1 AAA ATPase domain-containing protein [Arthrobacter subterraneus]